VLLYEELTKEIIGAAIEVHRNLGPGFLESVYENALANEFTARNIQFDRQEPVPVSYKQDLVGKYFADFIVENKIIVEIKAVSCFVRKHEAQALHYLTATRLRLALLLNFGTGVLTIKRIIL
jgi:GxxExxY protein